MGIGLIAAYSPFGKGFLAGKLNERITFPDSDIRSILLRFKEDAIQANKALLVILEEFARTKGATPTQVTPAWVIPQKPCIEPIPGTTKSHLLRENVSSVDLLFTSEKIDLLTRASSAIEIVGNRYTEPMEGSTGL